MREKLARLHVERGTLKITHRNETERLYNLILNLANETRAGKLDLDAAATRARDLIQAAATVEGAEIDPHR